MVGRELLTMCPDGEDHQGHDWGETEMVYPANTSRGMMMRDLKRLIRLMRLDFCDTLNHFMVTVMMSMDDFSPTSLCSMVWRPIQNKKVIGVQLGNMEMVPRRQMTMHISMITKIIL